MSAKLITVEQLNDGLLRQAGQSGRLGDHLVAAGYITEQALNSFLRAFPAEPGNLKATGIDEDDLLDLFMKQIYGARLRSIPEFADAIKLPRQLVSELVRMATERKLIYTKGVQPDNAAILVYDITEEGRRFAIDALNRTQYNGPTPVSLEQFYRQVNLQKITNEVVTAQRVRDSVSDLDMEQTLLEQAGPALNSGRAILLYGPPGNGKTTFALRLANVFTDIIYVPYAVAVESQIIRVFDSSIHIPVKMNAEDQESTFLRGEEVDARWIPCKRPFVVAGGELNLEMLDLRYEPTAKLYEAPLHMKALGGCFVIDDFGRQLVSPADLLNRWIVPLESRIDYLKLHTGKSFSIPFDELVIFSTNLDPEDLMDPAFLRRLPYKIEIGAPSVELFKRIFAKECRSHSMEVTDEVLSSIVHKITVDKQLELAAFQAKFILEQVAASCRFSEINVSLEPRFLDYAINNLRVRRGIAPQTSC